MQYGGPYGKEKRKARPAHWRTPYKRENRRGRPSRKSSANTARRTVLRAEACGTPYYDLVRKSRNEAFSAKYLNGEVLTAQEVRAFGAEEERTLVKTILLGKRDGRSARSVIFDLAAGDAKLALRFQNKYRNVLKTSPRSCVLWWKRYRRRAERRFIR